MHFIMKQAYHHCKLDMTYPLYQVVHQTYNIFWDMLAFNQVKLLTNLLNHMLLHLQEDHNNPSCLDTDVTSLKSALQQNLSSNGLTALHS